MAYDEYRENIEELEKEPDFIFFFPDKVWARIMDYRQFENSDGIEMIELIMRPDVFLMQKYNLRYDKDFNGEEINKAYEKSFIMFAGPGPSGVSLSLCDFNGRLGDELSAHFRNILNENRELRRKNKILLLGRLQDNRQIKMMATNATAFAKARSDLTAADLEYLRQMRVKDKKDKDDD